MCYASCGSNAIRILYRGSGVRVRVISPNVFFCTKIYAFPYTRRRRGGGRRLPQRVAVARTGRTVAERGNGTGRARERARASCVSWKGHTHYTAGICVARVPAGPRAQAGGLDVETETQNAFAGGSVEVPCGPCEQNRSWCASACSSRLKARAHPWDACARVATATCCGSPATTGLGNQRAGLGHSPDWRAHTSTDAHHLTACCPHPYPPACASCSVLVLCLSV